MQVKRSIIAFPKGEAKKHRLATQGSDTVHVKNDTTKTPIARRFLFLLSYLNRSDGKLPFAEHVEIPVDIAPAFVVGGTV